MFYNLIRASTKTTSSAEWSRHRADDHVDFSSVHVLVLCDASTGPAQDAEGPGLVEDEAEFISELEFDLAGSVRRGIQGWRCVQLTIFGRSTISPTFSNKPSVIMNLLVKGFFACSFVTFARTLCKSSISLCSYHLTVLLEIWRPFLIA